MDLVVLRSKIKHYKKLRERANALQQLIESVEDDIKAEMGENEELIVDGIRVTWTKYRALRFDTKAFKSEHMGIYEKYIKTSEARRFYVA